MIQIDDAVREIFFHPVARKLPLPLLGGENTGHAFVIQPSKKPRKLAADNEFILKNAEQCLRPINHHSLRLHSPKRALEPHKQTRQLEVADFSVALRARIDVVDE